jgi:hypothetical protein
LELIKGKKSRFYAIVFPFTAKSAPIRFCAYPNQKMRFKKRARLLVGLKHFSLIF